MLRSGTLKINQYLNASKAGKPVVSQIGSESFPNSPFPLNCMILKQAKRLSGHFRRRTDLFWISILIFGRFCQHCIDRCTQHQTRFPKLFMKYTINFNRIIMLGLIAFSMAIYRCNRHFKLDATSHDNVDNYCVDIVLEWSMMSSIQVYSNKSLFYNHIM